MDKGTVAFIGGGVEILVHATYGPYSKNGTSQFSPPECCCCSSVDHGKKSSELVK